VKTERTSCVLTLSCNGCEIGLPVRDHRPDVFDNRRLRNSDVGKYFGAVGMGDYNGSPKRKYELIKTTTYLISIQFIPLV
jgi:hypothetical protein